MSNETNSHRDIRIPAHLYDAAERLIKGTRFENVDAFVAFVLQELTVRDSTKFEEHERKVIEARLRDLGYL
jgi:Arc/MetJ-type ribon-helix-helix transcriptional regulator